MAFSIEQALDEFFNNSGGGGIQYGGTGQGRQVTGAPTGGTPKGGASKGGVHGGSGTSADAYPPCGGTAHSWTNKFPDTWNKDTLRWDRNTWTTTTVEYPDGSGYQHPGPVGYTKAPEYCKINSKGFSNWAFPYHWDLWP